MNLNLVIVLVLVSINFLINQVSADQVCNAVDNLGRCPAETCCKQSVCDSEGGSTKCCDDNDESLDCSLCPTCIDCEWTEWSACGKLEEQCGDGSKPQQVRGEKTRKYNGKQDQEVLNAKQPTSKDKNALRKHLVTNNVQIDLQLFSL